VLPVDSGAADGDRASVIIRPEQLTVADDDLDASFGVLDVVLLQSFFQGATHRYVCQLDNGMSVTATPSGSGQQALERVSPGQRLRLSYRRHQPHVIKLLADE